MSPATNLLENMRIHESAMNKKIHDVNRKKKHVKTDKIGVFIGVREKNPERSSHFDFGDLQQNVNNQILLIRHYGNLRRDGSFIIKMSEM